MTSTVADAALFLSSAAGLSIMAKATLFLALGLTATWLARRGRASVRHLLLAATFATLLALPVLVLLGPAVSIEIPLGASDDTLAATNTTIAGGSVSTPAPVNPNTASANSKSSRPSWAALAVGVWVGGAALLMMSIAFDLLRVRRIVRRGLPWIELRQTVRSLATEGGVRRAFDVLQHEDVAAPFMYGAWRPAIVLPAAATAWSDADLDRALVHELEHVRRVDWAVQLAARLTCACYWCHPLVWVAWRRLCLEAERACDDAVVQRAERTDYAEQLVSMAQRMSRANAQPVLGMANRSDLASRVTAVLDATQRRGRAGVLAAASAIGAAVLVVGAIAPARAVGVSPTRDAVVRTASAQSQSAAASRPVRSNALAVALFEAASDGDMDSITKLLDAGANVDAAIGGDGSPLIGAAREGRLDAVRLLLDRGADVDMGVSGDGNALLMAAREGHVDVVTMLLDRGASIDHTVPGDENALIQASGNGRLDVVKLLVSRGANVNARVWAPRTRDDGEWRTPLSMARRNRHAPVVEFLRSVGAVE
jgi:beta-lactamase regulating signal transducer with metallopeptidase domain